MGDLLQNPAVQSGVLPFIVGLVVSAAIARTRLLGLAQLAGFLVLVALAIGFSFESLTATKKLVLIAAGSGLALVVLEQVGAARLMARAALLAVLATACVWMLWRLLLQKETGQALLAGLLGVAYVVALAESTLRAGADPVRGAAAGLMLGLGTGVLCVLGASAVLGLAAISVGAAAGATLLVQMVMGRPAPAGSTISLPAAVVAGLAGVLVVLSASLPWYCLLPLLAVPWATHLIPLRVKPVWLRAFLSALAALVPALVAIGLAWRAASSS